MQFRSALAAQALAEPILPVYGDGGISGIVPGLLGAPNSGNSGPAVLLVVDGLGWNQLRERAHLTPTMTSMNARQITSVAPTTTAAGLPSISTGLPPGEHGLFGYRMEVGGSVMNVLRWNDKRGDLRAVNPPNEVQPCPPFMGSRVPVVSKSIFAETGFTIAHLRGADHLGWRHPSAIAVEVGAQLREGRKFVYAYYDGLDSVAHDKGFGPYYDAELETVDRLVESIIRELPIGGQLFVTADHGQVHVGDASVDLDPELLAFVRHQSGEGRFRWLHARTGALGDLTAAAQQYSDIAWVVTRERALDEGWFGRNVPSVHQQRLGDVALVARANVTFDDPDENGPYKLICRHGSLTPDEMLVPLLSVTA